MFIRKFLCIIFVIFLCILYLCSTENNSYNFISKIDNNFDIIAYTNDDDFVLKYYNKSYNYFVDKLHIKIIRIFAIDNRVIVEGFCDNLHNNFNDFFNVNIQLSSFDNCCIVGVPLINFSF